ncbi:MAG: hypothetical protein ABI690_20035, partial [Chloroflexota bacterium]
MGIRTSYKTLHTITRCILVAIMIAILIFELPVTAQTNSVYFPVGLGFTDVIPHQIVRLADDRVVIIAAKAQSVAQLEIYWTTVAGLPAQTSDFGGKLEVALPNAPISVDAVYDGSTTIHVLMNTLNGTIYDYPFDTSTNQVHPIISVATGSAAISGDYLGTSGISGAVDLSGTLHIAYWQNGNHIIHRAYTYSTAANTLTPLGAAFQVDTNGRANHPSLAVSPFDNSLTVGWVSEVGTPTRILVRVRASSGTWGSEEIVSNQPVWKSTNFGINIDQGPVIVIGTDGTKHLTYIKDFDPTQYGRVHYAVRHVGDTAWTDNELNTYSHDPAPAIDSAGQLYIIGHGPESTNQNDDMYYMKQNPDGSWAPITLFALHQGNNYLDSSPSVKWSAIGWNRPEAVEFLFFAANNGLYTNTTIYYARLPITAPTPTPTPSLTPTDTLTPTLTNTPTDTPTSTESPTPSNTPLPSDTPTPSLTPSNTTTPVDTATSPPTNTPPSTPTNTSTATSTPTATATATATLTPIATNTPIATVGPQTITVQISTGNDDVNEDIINNATVFTASGSTVWIGTGTSTTVSYTGLRFNSIVIPRGSTITTARLEFYSTSAQWQQVTLQVAAELSANSAAFSSTSRPSQRPLTIARVSHSSNVNWAINTWYQFDPMLAVVQEVINQSSWQSGNSMSLILHGTGSAFGRKNVRSYEGGATTAARLVISFSAPAVTAIPSPLPSPTLTPSFTPTATPTSTPTTTPTATNTATNTATSTSTSTPMPTNTATYTPTPTDTPTNTATPTDTATYTPIPSNTPTNTATFTLTPSNTPTNTATFTLTPSNTPTSTDTPTPTPTNSATPSNTPTLTLTPSTTPTNTATFTLTPSNTPTATYTPTDTPTPTPTNSATPSNTP